MADYVERERNLGKVASAMTTERLREDEAWNDDVFAALRKLIGATTADSFVKRFHDDLSSRFDALADMGTLERDAHVIASTAGLLGFQRLSRAARAMQSACHGEGHAGQCLVDLKSAKDDAITALRHHGANSAASVTG